MESKWYKFLDTLPEVEASNGDFGYYCTVGDMLDNGGRDEFFRTVRGKGERRQVSRNVYYNLEYDRLNGFWYADCYTDVCRNSPEMSRETVVFVGFDF